MYCNRMLLTMFNVYIMIITIGTITNRLLVKTRYYVNQLAQWDYKHLQEHNKCEQYGPAEGDLHPS